MKKRHSFLIPLMGVLLIAFLFSACKKDNSAVRQTPVAGLMAFNLVPGQSSIGIAISGSNLTNSPLYYTEYTGGYKSVFAGNRDVESYEFTTGSTLASATQLFEDSAYYSVFFVGANGNYRNIVVKDNIDSLSSSTGQAFVRYINAIADTTSQPSVTISANGTDVFNGNATFATVSDFKPVTAGDVSVNVNSLDNINANRTISLEDGKIYTVLLTGIPAATDSADAVQIKFIQNGEVTP
jgi:hypothetical protein